MESLKDIFSASLRTEDEVRDALYRAGLVFAVAPQLAGFCHFDGTVATPAVKWSYEVATVVKTAAGKYTITWKSKYPPKAVQVIPTVSDAGVVLLARATNITQTTALIEVFNLAGAAVDSASCRVSLVFVPGSGL